MSESPNAQSGKSGWKGMISLLAILLIPLYFFVTNYIVVKEGAEKGSTEVTVDSTQVTTPVDTSATK
ncbi:hypothetical protein KFE98_20425 [bacterium SCSIO 12741]|nr:hypothetical protein KFE98_20425 [bacterium SCSIO 12741]